MAETRTRRRAPKERPPLRVTFVLPDVAAVRQVAGTLAQLSTRKCVVHVGVAADPPGAPSLGAFDGAYRSLTVEALPSSPDDPWLALRTAARTRLDGRASSGLARRLLRLERAAPGAAGVETWIAAQRPDVLVVARLDGAARAHLDYLRAAHARGVPTIFLALAPDDVVRASLGSEVPGCVAVWNRAQRRDAIDEGVPSRRTTVIGAPLATDVLDRPPVVDRASLAASLDVDAARPLIVLASSGTTGAAVASAVNAWNQARMVHTDERVRSSAVIVRAAVPDGATALAAAALPGVVDVLPGAGARDFYEDARRLALALAHADVVVTDEADLAIEALSRAIPVVAAVGAPALDALCARMRRGLQWPRTAPTLQAQLDEVARILREPPNPAELGAARGFIRIHGDEIEPGFLIASRLVRKVTAPPVPAAVAPPSGLPLWALAARAVAVPPPRPASRGGKALLLFALPDPGSMAFWVPVMDALVARGHRVLATSQLTSGVTGGATSDRAAADRHRHEGIRHVVVPALVHEMDGWRALAAGTDLLLSLREAPESAVGVRWRRLLEHAVLPAAVRRFGPLLDRAEVRERLRASSARLDRGLAASAGARRLIDRERPEGVVLLPSLDASAALTCRMSHADIARAARARGIPVADGLLGSGALADTIAQGAVRTRGISRSHADAIASELEQWLQAAPCVTLAPRPLRAQAAGLRLVARGRLAAGARALEARMRSLLSLASRARSATR